MEEVYNPQPNNQSKAQKREYFIKNACYSVTKYYLCRQNNKRSLLGRILRLEVVRSFPNRYLFSCTNKVTSLFSISCILTTILPRNCGPFSWPFGPFQVCFRARNRVNEIQTVDCQRFVGVTKNSPFAPERTAGGKYRSLKGRKRTNSLTIIPKSSSKCPMISSMYMRSASAPRIAALPAE